MQLLRRGEDATDPDALAELHDAQQSTHPTPDITVPGADLGLAQALARLPVRQRMAIVMWPYADAKVSDIARSLDIDPNAAHQLLHRAKRALRAQLEGVST